MWKFNCCLLCREREAQQGSLELRVNKVSEVRPERPARGERLDDLDPRDRLVHPAGLGLKYVTVNNSSVPKYIENVKSET